MHLKSKLTAPVLFLLVSSMSHSEEQSPSKTAVATATATVINPFSINLKNLEQSNKSGKLPHIVISLENNQAIANFE